MPFNIKSYQILMSDTDSNQGQAEYSDDSDYDHAEESFLSGRHSKNIDQSIAQQTVEFKDIPKVENQFKSSVYAKKKNEVQREEQAQIKPFTNEQDSLVKIEEHAESAQASTFQPINNKQIFESVTVSRLLQEQRTHQLKLAEEQFGNKEREIPLDDIINDEENGDAVYSDDERDPRLDRESYMSTAPRNVEFNTEEQRVAEQKSGMCKKNEVDYQQQRKEYQKQQEGLIQTNVTHVEQNHQNQYQRREGNQPQMPINIQQANLPQQQKVEQPIGSVQQSVEIQQNEGTIMQPVNGEQTNIQNPIVNQQLYKDSQQKMEVGIEQISPNNVPQDQIREWDNEGSNHKLQTYIQQEKQHQQYKQQYQPAVQKREEILKDNEILHLPEEIQNGEIKEQDVHHAPQQSNQAQNQNQLDLKQQAIITLDSARSAQPILVPQRTEEQAEQVAMGVIRVERPQEHIKQLNQPAASHEEIDVLHAQQSRYTQNSSSLDLLANLRVVPTDKSQLSQVEPQRKLFKTDLQKKSQASVLMISRKAEKEYVPIEQNQSNQSYANLSVDQPRQNTINPPRSKTKLSSEIKEQPQEGESQACKCEIM